MNTGTGKLQLLRIAVMTLLMAQFVYLQAQKGKIGEPVTETQKIDSLIHHIESLQNARFWRNGSTYDSKEAAAHLRMKLNKAGGSIKTAEDFIDRIASGSSATGQKYKIIFATGVEIDTRTYLYRRLREMENEKQNNN